MRSEKSLGKLPDKSSEPQKIEPPRPKFIQNKFLLKKWAAVLAQGQQQK